MTIMPIVSANQQENTHAHLSFLSRPSARMAPLLPSMLLCDMSSVCMQSFLSSTCIKTENQRTNQIPHPISNAGALWPPPHSITSHSSPPDL